MALGQSLARRAVACQWAERGNALDIADRMKGLAFIQVRAAREAGGGFLDFSASSLAELDGLISRDVAKEPKDPDMLAEVIGAYVGETLVRRLGATWIEEDGSPVLRLGEIRLDPLRRAYLRVTEGEARSLMVYFDAAAAAKAGRLPAGRLEDA